MTPRRKLFKKIVGWTLASFVCLFGFPVLVLNQDYAILKRRGYDLTGRYKVWGSPNNPVFSKDDKEFFTSNRCGSAWWMNNPSFQIGPWVFFDEGTFEGREMSDMFSFVKEASVHNHIVTAWISDGKFVETVRIYIPDARDTDETCKPVGY